MSHFDVAAVLDAEPAPKMPLPNGFNPWEPPRYNTHDTWVAMYRRAIAEADCWAVCECCGKRWQVHPGNCGRAHACSAKCKAVMWRRRRRGDPTARTTSPLPHRPELKRRAYLAKHPQEPS